VLLKKGAVGGVVSGHGKRQSTLQSPANGKGKGEDGKANDDLINFLEHKLEEIEKKLSSTQSEYEML
jgi:hypothetical protein